ncbi:hypothetical protein [Cumulibacter manganitolerans]|uniref:hypothetical protein n=1 Tax=Cumulibacter manganitolerans TaxID=1884992 RepID=UPI0012978AC9|nr:hypothetical protein [Cumulibacter manganitolerans]
MIHLIAVLISIAGLLAVAGDAGYLMLLDNAAKTRGAAGRPVNDYVRSQWRTVAAAGGAGLLALLLTSGGWFVDILAMLIAAGAGTIAAGHLGKVRQKYGDTPQLGA